MDPRDLRLFAERLAELVLHQEIVDRIAGARGVDARVDDVCTGEVDAACHAVEQPRVVGRDYADAGCAAGLVGLAMDRQLLARGLRRIILPEVAGDDVLRLGDPVGIGQQRPGTVDQMLLIAQQSRDGILLRRHPLFSPVALVAQPQSFLGGIIELAQKLAFPAVPRARPDRADIDRGEDCEIAQALEALHLAGEILDRLGVGEIALLRGAAHEKVMEHQPGDQFGLASVHSETRAQAVGDFRAQHRVIAAAPLGDIV